MRLQTVLLASLTVLAACSPGVKDASRSQRGGPLPGARPTPNRPAPDVDRPAGGGVRILAADNGTVCGDDLAATTFRFAVCVCDDAAFAASVHTSSGGVAANGNITAAGALDIGGSLVAGGQVSPVGDIDITGDLIAGGDITLVGDANVGGDAFVGGDLTAIGLDVAGDVHANDGARVFGAGPGGVVRGPVSVDPPCACGDDQRTDVVGIVAAAANDNDNAANAIDTQGLSVFAGDLALSLPPGRFYFDSVHAAGRVVITVSGPTAMFVADDLALAGVLEVLLDGPDASLDLFISGDLAAAGALDLGSATAPSKVRIYVGGEGDIAIAGDAELGASLFAPDARVALAGSFTFNGALVAGDLAHAGDLNVNYDADVLDGAGDGCDDDLLGDDGVPSDGVPSDDVPADDLPGDGVPADDQPGAPPADGTCASPADCGNQACVDGECGACGSTLDCAGGLSCVDGSCLAIGG